MRIGFDISQIAHPGGVATYTKSLAENLSKIKELEMVYFYSSLRRPFKGKLKGVKAFRLPPTLFEVLFNRVRNVPIEKFLGPLDIFHSSDWVQPPSKAKKVTTYHDVIPLKFPQWSHPKIVDVHKRRLKLVEKEIDMVIAVSESTKNDLLKLSNIPEEKITVIYEGVGNNFKPRSKERIEEFKKKYKLPDEFILAIGGVGERKNLKRIKQASKGFDLVITGETLSFIPDEDMPLLYSAASILLYPTLYEGFGLPVLESMACGTPVVTSYNSSIPEIAGKAVLFAKEDDVEDIKKRIEQAMDNGWRKDLIKEGLKQAAKFSWEKTAKETAEVYRKVLKG